MKALTLTQPWATLVQAVREWLVHSIKKRGRRLLGLVSPSEVGVLVCLPYCVEFMSYVATVLAVLDEAEKNTND